jgi:phosphate transport system substrate-binding protein
MMRFNSCAALLWALLAVTSSTSAAEPESKPSTSLEIRGSGAMGSLARAMAEQYMTDHPEATVTVETCGAFQALKSLIIGTCEMAMGTDEVPEQLEKLAKDRGVRLKRTDVYSDALVVLVRPGNPVSNLSLKQLRDIFRGAILNWQEVGGDDAPIEVFTHSSTSAAYEVFKRRVLGNEAVMTPKATNVSGRELKEKLNAHAIAYAGIIQLTRIGADAQALTVDGVAASSATIADGTYPIVRRMSLYQRVPTNVLADRLTEYFFSPTKGRKAILAAGNVPVK